MATTDLGIKFGVPKIVQIFGKANLTWGILTAREFRRCYVVIIKIPINLINAVINITLHIS